MDPQKQTSIQASPWKKPNRVSLAKTKSLKRKSELFNGSLNNSASNGSFRFESNPDIDENASLTETTDSPRSSKVAKTVLNRFSIVNSNSLSNSLSEESPAVSY